MSVDDDVSRIAAEARRYSADAEEVVAVIAVDPTAGDRLYLCAFESADGSRSWLALAEDGSAVPSRERVRDAASIAALCEVAEETAGVAVADDPRVASLAYLDSLGGSGDGGLAVALQGALPAVEELVADVEGTYKLELE